MNGRSCKRKGRKWEKEVSQLLGVWYYDDANALTPTKSSGAIKTLVDQTGDIGITRTGLKPWIFSVECKKQEGWTLEEVFTRGKKSPLIKFWEQCLGDAGIVRKIPMMVIRRNYGPILIGMRRVDIMDVDNYNKNWMEPRMDVCIPGILDMSLFDLDVLLGGPTPAVWRKYWRRS